MELQIDLDCPQGLGDINVPTPMELQTVHKDKNIKIPPPWNFKLTWTVREDKMISNSHPHGTSIVLGLSTRIRWYQNSHPMELQNTHPHTTSNWLGPSTRIRWYQNSQPMELQNTHPDGTSNWLGLPAWIRWYQNSHPYGTSNVLGPSTRIRWYQIPTPWNFKIPTPMELQIDFDCPHG